VARLLGDEGERDKPQIALRQHAAGAHHVVGVGAVAAAAAHAVAAEMAAPVPPGGPFPMPFVPGFAMSKHIECFSF
jgi:hypothetical protein